MKYKFPINFAEIAVSGYLIYAFMENLRVSGPKPDYLSWSSIPYVFAYLIAYLLVVLISRRYNQLLDVVSLIVISFLGSFIFTCYDFVRLINGPWSDRPDAAGVLLPTLIFGIFLYSIIFFLISLFFMCCIWIVTNASKVIIQKT